MKWMALLGVDEAKESEPFKAHVLDGRGVCVARIRGSADYVCKLATAMCERESIDVSDLLAKPTPVLYCIHGGLSG